MGQLEIEAFLNNMTDKRKVSANTQSVALSAIAFLYKEVLKQEKPCLEKLRKIKRYKPIPVVMSPREIQLMIGNMGESGYLGVISHKRHLSSRFTLQVVM